MLTVARSYGHGRAIEDGLCKLETLSLPERTTEKSDEMPGSFSPNFLIPADAAHGIVSATYYRTRDIHLPGTFKTFALPADAKGAPLPTIEELATIFPANFAPFTNSKFTPEQCCQGPHEFVSFWTSELDVSAKDYAFVYHWYAQGGANNCYASRNFSNVRCVHDPVAADRPVGRE